MEDPSLRYLANPRAAPVVQQAISFFEEEQEYYPKNKFLVVCGPTTDWRTVVKLAVRMQQGVLRIGLFVPGSHTLLEVPQCQVHHPRINAAVEVIQKKCRAHGIVPFDEHSGKGNLSYVAINVERTTGFQQVTLVWKPTNNYTLQEDNKKQLTDLCETLIQVSQKNDDRLHLHSLWIHYNTSWKHSNSIFDRDGRWEKKYGPSDAVIERLDIHPDLTVPLRFPPQVFRQANIDAFSNIIIKIRSWLQNYPSVKRCLELYGGVGTIGLHLVDIFESLTSSDENPFNKSCFEATLKEIQVQKPSKKRCQTIMYESKNATDMVQSSARINQNVDVVIVDPPRKGLDAEVVAALCRKNGPNYLIYVSCGFQAFTRDFQSLTVSGNWRLDHAEGHILFPGSNAIETLAMFTRL